VSAHKPATPLLRQATRMLRELTLATIAPGASHNKMK
jgi:hypothetical protein